MGKYQALVDLSLGANFYVNAGEQFSDTDSRVPIGWEPPCHAVSPLDADAVNKVWLMGPQLPESQPWQAIFPWGQSMSRWVGSQTAFAPSTWWYRTTTEGMWALKGHEALGLRAVGSVVTKMGAAPHTAEVKDVAPAVAVEREDWWRALIKEDDAFSVNELVPALFRLTTAITWDQFRYEAGTVVSNKPPPTDKRPWHLQGPPIRYLPGLNHQTLPGGLVPLNTQARSMHRRSKYAGEQVSATISGVESIG